MKHAASNNNKSETKRNVETGPKSSARDSAPSTKKSQDFKTSSDSKFNESVSAPTSGKDYNEQDERFSSRNRRDEELEDSESVSGRYASTDEDYDDMQANIVDDELESDDFKDSTRATQSHTRQNQTLHHSRK